MMVKISRISVFAVVFSLLMACTTLWAAGEDDKKFSPINTAVDRKSVV